MDNIFIDDKKMPIEIKDFIEVCENLRKRVIKILYLKEDYQYGKITEYDLNSYINGLKWDLYGTYITFSNYKFLNCICELEGIREYILDEFTRKKLLDLAGFIYLIGNEKKG
jgi:hypothetical protein